MPILSQFDNLRRESINIKDLVEPQTKSESLTVLSELIAREDWNTFIDYVESLSTAEATANSVEVRTAAQLIHEIIDYPLPNVNKPLSEYLPLLVEWCAYPERATDEELIQTVANLRILYKQQVDTIEPNILDTIYNRTAFRIKKDLEQILVGDVDVSTLELIAYFNMAFPQSNGWRLFNILDDELTAYQARMKTFGESAMLTMAANLRVMRPDRYVVDTLLLDAMKASMRIYAAHGMWAAFASISLELAIVCASGLELTKEEGLVLKFDYQSKMNDGDQPPPRRQF